MFYRVNFMQRALEQALARLRIPHEVVSGTAFYERREIKDLVAWLRLIVNPADDEAFRRAIASPARGVGAKSLAALAEWAEDRRVPLLRAAASTELAGQLRGRAKAALQGFVAQLLRLEPLRAAGAGTAVEQVLAETRYLDWLAGLEGDDVDRDENVREFLARAETFERDHPDLTLRDFLADVALVSDADAFDEGAGKVALMTLHTAKGLEFPVVFIAGLEERLLPHARSIEAFDEGGVPGRELEEERRLLYVGMTRAREKLCLSWARRRRHFGQESWSQASRFLDEIPAHLIEGHGTPDEASVLGEYEPQAGPALEVGDSVRHDHFGMGRVERLAGSGINARATVLFDHAGRRELLLQYAKLERLG